MSKIKYPVLKENDTLLDGAIRALYYFGLLIMVFIGVLIGVISNLPSNPKLIHYFIIAPPIVVLTFSSYFFCYWLAKYRAYNQDSF